MCCQITYLGYTGDSVSTIEETYKLSEKLNTLGINIYPAMALPGTPLYQNAMINGIKVPEEYEEFSFHSYEAIPLPTEHLKPFEILKLRDEKFNQYFERKEFLNRIKENLALKPSKILEK